MFSNTSNSNPPATPQQIKHYISQAHREHTSSKTAASHTAANLYMVWAATMFGKQSTPAGEALRVDIAKYDDNIAKFNDAIDDLYSNSHKMADGKITADDIDHKPRLDSSHTKSFQSLVALVKSNGAFKIEDHRKVPAKSGRKDSELNALVKFALKLDHDKDSSVASRYVAVVTLLQEQFSTTAVNDIDVLVEHIKALGGFERALLQTRAAKSSNAAKSVVDDTQAVAAVVKKALVNAVAVGSVALSAKSTQDGLVVLIGRSKDNTVDVLGEVAVRDFDSVIAGYRNSALFAIENDIQFLERITRLATLVSADPVAPGAKRPIDRALTLLASDGSPVSFIVSAVSAAASVVVRATPKAGSTTFASTPGVYCLDVAKLGTLTAELQDELAQSCVEITSAQADGRLTWTANSALRPSKDTVLEWDNLAEMRSAPVDADIASFVSNYATTIARAHVSTLLVTRYSSLKGKPKADKTIEVGFSEGQLVFCARGRTTQEDASVAKLTCRELDIKELFALLVNLNVDAFDFAIDARGMLQVTWNDDAGSYSVYVPAVMAGGGLNPTRIVRLEANPANTLA